MSRFFKTISVLTTPELWKGTVLYSTKELGKKLPFPSFISLTQAEKDNRLYSFTNFLEYIRKFWLQHTLTLIFALIGYGLKVFSVVYSIDTEAIMEVPDSLYKSWFGLERFGLVVLKYLSGVYWYNNALASFLTVLFLLLATILWSYLINNATTVTDTKPLPTLFSVIFIASPVLAEMLGFLLLGPEIGISLCLIAISLMHLYNAISIRKIRYALSSCIIATCAFSIYLATVTVFITGTAILLLLSDRYTRKTNKLSWLFIGAFAADFGIAYLIYSLANKTAQFLTGIPTDPYISEQSRWGKDSLALIFSNIKDHAFEMYRGTGIYYSGFFSVLCIISLAIQIVRSIRRESSLLSLLVMLLVCASPLIMSFVVGGNPSTRTEFSYPLAFAFIAYFIALFVSRTNFGKVTAWILVVLLACNQAFITNRIFYSEKVRFNSTVQLSYEIKNRIDLLDLGDVPDQPVVFIGSPADACNASCIPENQIAGMTGWSTFRLTVTSYQGTFVKNNFMRGLGITYHRPNKSQVDKAVAISADMSSWPSTKSIKLSQGLIIVKFS